jgi:hypothetical protein
MTNGTQNLPQATEGDASQEHPEPLPNAAAPPPIEQLILHLVPSRKHSEIVRLFDGRVGYSTIKHWRRGRREAPEWAREMLIAKLEERANACMILAHRIRLHYAVVERRKPHQGMPRGYAGRFAPQTLADAEKKKAGG